MYLCVCVCVCDGDPYMYRSSGSLLSRKFADIGLKVQHQYQNPQGWAHLVTAHAIAGPGTIQVLMQMALMGTGCVVVLEMSTIGTLATKGW